MTALAAPLPRRLPGPGVARRWLPGGAAVAVALVLAGCSATARQSWRTAPDLSSPVWTISGTQSLLGKTTISINDQPVAEGSVSVWTGRGELTGAYEGKPVVADCKKGRGASVRSQCVVTIDGRRITTLYFRFQ